ncbi:hypothetical protein PVAP13_6NG090709 [Panicum virgatum]|uniref:Uncharacterized protein n=1 Tax=Panicum virgatum TaxID=38727 RepID=A0A8T0QVM2_PANVG|nr:hypothetical protein PVAP13_6NG090709 [Panicum virgatum]
MLEIHPWLLSPALWPPKFSPAHLSRLHFSVSHPLLRSERRPVNSGEAMVVGCPGLLWRHQDVAARIHGERGADPHRGRCGAARIPDAAQIHGEGCAAWRGFPVRLVADPQRGADPRRAWRGGAAWMQGGCADARSSCEAEGRGLRAAMEMLGRWRMLVAGLCLRIQHLAPTTCAGAAASSLTKP